MTKPEILYRALYFNSDGVKVGQSGDFLTAAAADDCGRFAVYENHADEYDVVKVVDGLVEIDGDRIDGGC